MLPVGLGHPTITSRSAAEDREHLRGDPKTDQRRWSERAKVAEELAKAECQRSEKLQEIEAEHQRLLKRAEKALELLRTVDELREFEASLTTRLMAADVGVDLVKRRLAETAPVHLERLIGELRRECRRIELMPSDHSTDWKARNEYVAAVREMLKAAMAAVEDPELTPDAIREMFKEFHNLQLESSLDGSE